jgi:hypothetical protein
MYGRADIDAPDGVTVVFENGRPVAIMGLTVVGGRIVEIDVIRDPDRLARLDLTGV